MDEATLDDKGRVLVSKKKRDRLGVGFAMCIGDKGCIYAYSALEWQKVCGILMNYDPTNFGTIEYTHQFMRTAEDDLDFDLQGRVVIPQKLRKEARINEKVLLIGCLSRLEIWAFEEFERFEADRKGYERARRQYMRRAYAEMKGEAPPPEAVE